MRNKGHKLKTEWNGRRGADAVTVGTCECGKWKKAGSSQETVRNAYRSHLTSTRRRSLSGR